MREIIFRAYIKALNVMIDDFSINPDGTIGIEQDDFLNQIGGGYYSDNDSLISKTDHCFVMPLLTGEDYIGLEKEQFNLMQFTGLKDKNGRKIYEGDIVKAKFINYAYDEIDSPNEPKYIDKISFVEFRNHGFWVNDESFGYEGENLWNWNEMEVIGNIYENPELLNDKI